MDIIYIPLLFMIFTQSPGIYAVQNITNKEYAVMPPIFHLDDFDRCMFLEERALYCSITIQLSPMDPKNTSEVWKIIQKISSHPRNYGHDLLRHGICVSESCPYLAHNISIYKYDHHGLQSAISECYKNKYKDMGLLTNINVTHCETDQPFYNVDDCDVIVGICFIAFIMLIIFASFYEGLARYKPKETYVAITETKFGKVISCFSIVKNWNRLRNESSSSDASSLRCLNGLRFFNMVLVIMVHVCMCIYGGAVLNPQYAENIIDDPLSMLVFNGDCVIQTFLLISGWLLSFYLFSMLEGKKNVKISYIFLALVNRYVRLTPCLLVMIALNSTWLYHAGRGAYWDKFMGAQYRNCRTNWWTNLLYINNYFNSEMDKMCLQESWYLAADMQLFLLSMIVALFMLKFKKYAKTILGTSIIISIIVPGVVNYINDFDIVVRHYPEPLYEFLLKDRHWHVMYASSYSNMGSAMLGLMFGYIFYNYRHKSIHIKMQYEILWWIVIWGLPLSAIFIGIPMYDANYVNSKLLAALNASLSKNLFVFGVGLGILGITRGIGGFVRDATMWSPMNALGRLTYCAYLVHVTILRLKSGQMRTPYYFTNFGMLTQTCGDVALAYMLATPLCLTVEMPISALQKLFLPTKQKKEIKTNANETTRSNITINSNI